MFSIESGANNSFIQSHRSAVSTSSVCKVSSDLNHKPDADLREANNFLEVARTLVFSDGRCCLKQRLNFATLKTTRRCYFLRVEKITLPEKTQRTIKLKQNSANIRIFQFEN